MLKKLVKRSEDFEEAPLPFSPSDYPDEVSISFPPVKALNWTPSDNVSGTVNTPTESQITDPLLFVNGNVQKQSPDLSTIPSKSIITVAPPTLSHYLPHQLLLSLNSSFLS